jgi:hypothetical protein
MQDTDFKLQQIPETWNCGFQTSPLLLFLKEQIKDIITCLVTTVHQNILEAIHFGAEGHESESFPTAGCPADSEGIRKTA